MEQPPHGHPGPARTDRGRRGPFSALIAAADRSAESAQGLALAYASLDPDARRRLVEAVVADAEAEGVSPAIALAALLSVEEEPSLARRLAEAIRAADPEPLLRGGSAEPRALLAGTEGKGAAVLIRPLHGEFVEALALDWAEGRVRRALFEPMLHRSEAESLGVGWPEGDTLAPTPFEAARRMVVAVAWRERRRGASLPEGLHRFADLL